MRPTRVCQCRVVPITQKWLPRVFSPLLAVAGCAYSQGKASKQASKHCSACEAKHCIVVTCLAFSSFAFFLLSQTLLMQHEWMLQPNPTLKEGGVGWKEKGQTA